MTYLPRYQENKIYDPQFDESGAVEFLTLAQLKSHLTIDFTDDDVYLTDLIVSCRAAIESYCNISLVQKTVYLFADLYCELELPYGPVNSLTTAELETSTGTYTTQTANTDYVLSGITGGFQRFRPLSSGRWKLTFNAGFAAAKVPKDIILDHKRICGYCYENKGDQALTSLQGGMERPKGLDEALELFASRHRRLLWI